MRTFFGIALTLMFMAVLLGCTVNPVTGKKQLTLINDQQEIAMGQESAPQFEKEFDGVLDDKVVNDYVASVGKKVAAVSDRPMPYEFAVLNSDVPNAFSLPGGKVYVTKGLMKLMENERQLAAVLGHEVGHVAAKHQVTYLNYALGSEILLEVAGGKDTNSGQVAQVVSTLVTMHHSQSNEYQADSLGIKYMSKAGYNPNGMVGLLHRLETLTDQEPGVLDQMFLTHPVTSKRIVEADGIVKKDYPTQSAAAPDPRAATFLAMRARLK